MNCEKLTQQDHLQGFITEQNFDQAEEAFPGIATFYEHCRRKPSTFLDLVWQFGKNLADRNDVLRAGMPLGAGRRDAGAVSPSGCAAGARANASRQK